MTQSPIDRALTVLLAECRKSGHELCEGSMICEEGVISWKGNSRSSYVIEDFDSGRDALRHSGETPEWSWPTTRLVGFTRFHLLNPPVVGGLWRGTAITTALGRLAERGIPVDGLVRNCIGPELVRRIIVTSENILLGIRRGEQERDRFDYLEAWFKLLESNEADDRTDPELSLGRAAVSQGVRDAVEQWLSQASITHVMGWRLDNFMPVEPDRASTSLPAGIDALYWIYERSTETYVDYWRPDSRGWEQAWITDPATVEHDLGISSSFLSGREVSQEELVKGTARSVINKTERLSVDQMGPRDVFETLIAMIDAGALRPARDLARRAHQKYPQNQGFLLMLVFCTIPLDPSSALSMLEDREFTDGSSKIAATVDRASIEIINGSLKSLDSVRSVTAAGDPDGALKFWLWDPATLLNEPQVVHVSALDWVSMVISGRQTAASGR